MAEESEWTGGEISLIVFVLSLSVYRYSIVYIVLIMLLLRFPSKLVG